MAYYPIGYYIGHEMLGDAVGFCAAAHLFSCKVKQTVKVYVPELKSDVVTLFDGIEWVEKSALPHPIDCGANPEDHEWSYMNGVKRFYKYMDSTFTCPKQFGIHFNIPNSPNPDKIIGVFTHSHSQGKIDSQTLNTMLEDAKKYLPDHKLVLMGHKTDNELVRPEIEDRRLEYFDNTSIFRQVRNSRLMISPQSGPCFLAAGFGVELWAYRSFDPVWDMVMDYDNHKPTRLYRRRNSGWVTMVEVWNEVNAKIAKQKTKDYCNERLFTYNVFR